MRVVGDQRFKDHEDNLSARPKLLLTPHGNSTSDFLGSQCDSSSEIHLNEVLLDEFQNPISAPLLSNMHYLTLQVSPFLCNIYNILGMLNKLSL